MPQPQLPIIQTTTLPVTGWTVADRRTLRPEVRKTVMRLWTARVVEYIESINLVPRELICGIDPSKRSRDVSKYHAALALDPSLEWDAFESSGATREKETSFDLRRPAIFLGVRDGSRFVGGLSISNIDVVRIGGRINMTGLMIPGIDDLAGLDRSQTRVEFFRELMSTPFASDSGFTMRFVAYSLPVDLAFRRHLQAQPELIRFLRLMRAKFDVSGDTDDLARALVFRSRVA